MAELYLSYSARKNYRFFLILLLIGIGFNSCKKDLLVPRASPIDVNKSKIKTISYTEFLSSINLNNTGTLKTTLSNAAKSSQGAIMNVNSAFNGFNINTDSIKKLTLGDTISYVISLKPETRHAIQFRNLTIQVINNKTTAFLTTYVPTQEWVKDWKSNKHLGFKGEIYANKINLYNTPSINGLNNSSQGSKGSIMSQKNATSEILINHNKISLAPGECEIYDVYELVPYTCSTGDWPGHCIWETNITSMSELDHLPGYRMDRTTVINCAAPSFPVPPTGGGGGGGGTTPNPPGGYDPCDCDTPTPVSVVGGNIDGLKLAVVAPNCCDEGGDLPPLIENEIYSFKIQSLIDNLNLQGNNLNYVINNQDIGSQLYDVLEADGFSYEGKIASNMTISMLALGTLTTSDNNLLYNSVSSYLPNAQNYDHQMYAAYWIMQCAIIKAEHPEYGEWRLAWEASKEMVHLALDGLGLVPGVGEVADLANGLIYTIEGDGVNATFSYASAVPFVGWFSFGAKMAKKTLNLANGAKTTLKWTKKVGDIVNFGDRAQLRKVLNLLPGDVRQAHHIIPWDKQTHDIIQKAAKKNGTNPFHMNDALNGVPVASWRNQPNHNVYNNLIKGKLDAIPSNLTPDQAYSRLLDIVNEAKQAIINNPNTHLNDLIF